MDRDPNPYMNYHGKMRRTARKTVNPRLVGRRLNPEPIYPPPQPIPTYHATMYHFEPRYNPNFPVEHLNDPEPEYHPAPEYPDDMYDPDPVQAAPPNAEHAAPAPGSPEGSHHSSVGDNFDYIELNDLIDNDADDLHYDLDTNHILTQTLYVDYLQADLDAESVRERHLRYLSRVRELYGMNMHFQTPYPPGDWIRSTLHHFPHTRFWVDKINGLFDEGPIENVYTHLLQIRRWVHQSM